MRDWDLKRVGVYGWYLAGLRNVWVCIVVSLRVYLVNITCNSIPVTFQTTLFRAVVGHAFQN